MNIVKMPRPKRDDRDVIRLTSDLHVGVDEAVEALAADTDIYQRDGALVRVVRVAESEAARERTTVGTPQIRPTSLATLRERLTRVARFERLDARSNEWVPTVPQDRVVSAVHARGEWPGVRPLVGIIETPSMRPDGTLIDVAGYDPNTGYVYAPQNKYPAVPSRPSKDDAARALAALLEPWSDFPVRGEPDRFVPIAALLTLVARPAVRGACPAFLIDKSTRGSGGTLVARAVTTLAHGREASLMNWPTDPVELEKILGAYALRGAPVIVWDNVVGTFGGGPLDKVLTCADRTDLRVLGQSTVPSLSWRAVTIATGNNMLIGGDTTRRTLVCRLEPQCERPEDRTGYTIGDLIGWCRVNHPRLVAAALTVLRGYDVAGRPDMALAGWGSYEAWRDLIAGAIAWAGGANVMETRPTLAGEDDSDTAALRTITELWPLLAPDGTAIRAAVAALYPNDRGRGESMPDGYDGLREALETLAPPARPGMPPSSQRLSYAFRRYRRRVIGTRYLDNGGTGERGHVASWRICEVSR